MADGTIALLSNWDTWGVFGVLTVVNLVVLLYRTRYGAAIRPRVVRLLRRLSGRGDLEWLDWRPLAVIAAVWFGGFSAYGILSGQYGCQPGILSDALGVANSGQAFWAGANPFAAVPYCGSTIGVPYGLAAVLLDALGSLGGLTGICLVWGAVVLSILPLTWWVGGDDRRYLTIYVASSILFVPLATSEFGGATNAIVPMTLLLALYLAQRGGVLAAALGGFLSTARFPSLFPVLAMNGSVPRWRGWGFLAAAGAFGGATALSYAVWGTGFLNSVFVGQIARRSYSLNVYGILLFHNALPSTLGVEAVQAALMIAVVVAVFVAVRSPVRAVAITIVAVTLVTPFLSYNFLIWLLPCALAGTRARWWLWGVATVGAVNFNLGLISWSSGQGIVWPAEVMDVVLTALLLGLFVDLWRGELAARRARLGPTVIPA
ncbi:MAG: hypothetical protein ACLPWO_05650 [Thermoplasmata archaeon]